MWKAAAAASAGAAPISSPSGGGIGAPAAGPGGWHPSVLTMLGLVVAEIAAVAFLSRHLR